MLKKFISSLLKNLKILGLIFLIIFTIIIATLSNYQKKLIKNENINILNNIYLEKTYVIYEFQKHLCYLQEK